MLKVIELSKQNAIKKMNWAQEQRIWKHDKTAESSFATIVLGFLKLFRVLVIFFVWLGLNLMMLQNS